MVLIVCLVMIGGIFAGLTIGLMGLDETNLHVLIASGTPKEQVHAETVYKLLSRGKHWVLVTLLLGNVIVNETLPVVLDSELGGGIIAILISTMLIVIFGEIIPQAVCARYGLAIGSYCAKPMLVLMYLMSPVAYPIALLLDSWLGVHHGTTYRRTELKTLVSLHQVDRSGELTDDEVTIIASVLDLKEKSVSQIMTPLEDVFTLSEDAILNEHLMEQIVSAGYSRIPIYRHDDSSNFIGMLLVKRLITYDPEDHIAVRQFPINSLPEVPPNTSCLDILNFFQEGRSHMAMVTSDPGGFGDPVGVITLEDVIEELLGEEIVDESDVYVDVHNKIKVIRKPTRNLNFVNNLKTLLRSPALASAGATPVLPNSETPLLKAANGVKQQHQDQQALNIPPENYLSTGKTIIQPRKTSFDGGENQLLLEGDGDHHDCAFRTESPFEPVKSPVTKDSPHLNSNNDNDQQQQQRSPTHAASPETHYLSDNTGNKNQDLSSEAQQQEQDLTPTFSTFLPGYSNSSSDASTISAGSIALSEASAIPTLNSASNGSNSEQPRRAPQGLSGVDSRTMTSIADESASLASSTTSNKKKKKKKKSSK
ncbi:hypothetical protein BGZ49_010800 [Haplosporangium sp. Z 27]|nr:hypothetical protein BGZ49_010800 [Haplosporangium sp. Z 27]